MIKMSVQRNDHSTNTLASLMKIGRVTLQLMTYSSLHVKACPMLVRIVIVIGSSSMTQRTSIIGKQKISNPATQKWKA